MQGKGRTPEAPSARNAHPRAENLASKGYVVAAIDHTDSVFGAQAAFTSTLLNLSADQLRLKKPLLTASFGLMLYLPIASARSLIE
jgi:predicted dienelactone hydrolase